MSLQVDTLFQEHDQIILDQFLSIALGGNSFLHPFIEDCYQKNEWEFYESYQKSGLKGNPLFLMYSINSEDKIRKVAGIIEWCNQNQQFALIDQLIKKGYKFAYQYLPLDSAKQDSYLEMKSKEAQIMMQEADLLRRQQTWEFTHKRQQKEIEGLTEELREANSKIRQLEQQIQNIEDYAEEVHALRNYAYREERDDHNTDNAPSIYRMAEFIQTKRIVIFGGSPNWRQKLKEFLPAVEFVDVDDKNRDISKIQRVDAVFINTSVFAHAFYKKIIKELSNSKTPLYYLNGQSNTEKNILEIYEWLTE